MLYISENSKAIFLPNLLCTLDFTLICRNQWNVAIHAPFNKTDIKIGHKTLRNCYRGWNIETGLLNAFSLFQSSSSVSCLRPIFVPWALWLWGWSSAPPFSFATAGRLRQQGALTETGARGEKDLPSCLWPVLASDTPAAPLRPAAATCSSSSSPPPPPQSAVSPTQAETVSSDTVRHTSPRRQRTSSKIRFQHQGALPPNLWVR